jgi:type VI secretion system secreted protein VgrG
VASKKKRNPGSIDRANIIAKQLTFRSSTMADFTTALRYTLRHEGGWVDHPDDPGGATNFGITLATAKSHGISTAQALRGITQGQVAAIYKSDYWFFDGIASQRVATKVFDMAVNIGPKMAIKYLQGILVVFGETLAVDGVFGPVTEAATNRCKPDELLDRLCRVSEAHYSAIVAKRPKSAKFLSGWIKRARGVP